MNEYVLDTAPQPIAIGAYGQAEIEQNIRLIVATMAYSVRMDCRFADTGGYIDSPAPFEAMRRMATLTEAIEKYEPRVKVLRFYTENDTAAMQDGKLFPRLRYGMREDI